MTHRKLRRYRIFLMETAAAGTRAATRRPPGHPSLRADRLLDVDARAPRGTGRGRGRGRPHPRRVTGLAAVRRRSDRARRRDPAPRAHGHGAQLPHGRPRLDAHELGPGRPRDEVDARHPELPAHAPRRLHDRPQPRSVRADRRAAARRHAHAGSRRGMDSGSPDRPCRARDHAQRRSSGSDDVPGLRSRRPAAHRRRGDRRRCRAGPPGGALPDQVRRAGDQGVRVRRRHVAHGDRGRCSTTPTTNCASSSTRRTAEGSRSRLTHTATRASAPRSRPGSTASSTRR